MININIFSLNPHREKTSYGDYFTHGDDYFIHGDDYFTHGDYLTCHIKLTPNSATVLVGLSTKSDDLVGDNEEIFIL